MGVGPARAKVISPTWVDEQLRAAGVRFDSLYEPFCGQARLSQHFKRRGKQVVAGDLLESHYCHALAFIENGEKQVAAARLAEWSGVIRDPAIVTRFAPWAGVHVTREEAIWLGIWHAHLAHVSDPIERALGAVAVGLTLQYWQGLDPLGSKPLAPLAAFGQYVQTANSWVCSSHHRNQALRGDAGHMAPRVEADLLFCYPPTNQGFSDYPVALRLFECWVKGDPLGVLPGLAGAPADSPPTLGMVIPEPSHYAEALRRFLSRAEHIPVWAIAFNDRYPLDEAAMVQLVQDFRPVRRRAGLTVATGVGNAPPGERLIIAQARGSSRPES